MTSPDPRDEAVAHLEKAASLLMMHDYVTTARQVLEIRKLLSAAKPPAIGADAVARREAAMLVMEMAEDRDPDNVAEMFRIYENAPHDCEERTGVRKPYGCGRCDVERAYAVADRIRSALSPAATSGSEAGEAVQEIARDLCDAIERDVRADHSFSVRTHMKRLREALAKPASSPASGVDAVAWSIEGSERWCGEHVITRDPSIRDRWANTPERYGVSIVPLCLAAHSERQQEAIAQLDASLAGMADPSFPLGAIENGRGFADRLEMTGLECPAGDLRMCSDWQEFRRCFDHLAEWALSHAALASLSPAATSGSEAGGDVLAGWCQPNGITKQAQYDIDQAIGGTYELPDGRSFWLDHVAVKEIMRRAIPYIAAECERHRLIGGRTAKPAKQGGC